MSVCVYTFSCKYIPLKVINMEDILYQQLKKKFFNRLMK